MKSIEQNWKNKMKIPSMRLKAKRILQIFRLLD